jgi:DNA polymerase-1
MALGRLVKFNTPSLQLDHLAHWIGEKKSDSVKAYCQQHGLWEWVIRPGKKKREKNYFFSLVPRDIVNEYAKIDAAITRKLGIYEIQKISSADMREVGKNENRLTKTLFKMEQVGIKIDREFIGRAIEHESKIIEDVVCTFKTITTLEFKDSNKCLSEAYEREGYNYKYTEKGNPSFSAKNIKGQDHQLADIITTYRQAHARRGTYESIAYYSDGLDICHPNAKQSGCVTGRMSYSNPPIQCMEKVEKDDPDYNNPYLIRRSFVPREGFVFAAMDFDQFEYRMMLNYAEEMDLIEQVKAGIDVHQATADILGTSRRTAKTINFALLYGTGAEKLGGMLGVPVTEAQALKAQYFRKLPKVKQLIQSIHKVIEQRGYIRNWMGRTYHLHRNEAYKAPNYLIQGGTADWMKVAMNKIDDYLQGHKSRMLLQIHDELLFEIHHTEYFLLPELKRLMETAVENPLFRHLPFTVGVDISAKSWQDKETWTSVKL